MIVVKITMAARPEKQLELMQTLHSIIDPTGRQAGCLKCAAYRDIANPNRFGLLEEWKTREDLNQHLKSGRFSVLLGTNSLLCEPMITQIFTVSNSEGMEAVDSVRQK